MNHNRFVTLAAAGVLLLAGALAVRAQEVPEEARQLAQQAQDLARADKFDQAVDVMKKAIQAAPDNDLLLAMTSQYEMKAGHYTDGVEHALRAIKLNDKVGTYYMLVAVNSVGDQDVERAQQYCKTVLEGGPSKFGAAACKDAQNLLDTIVPTTYTLHWNLDPQKGRMVNGTLALAMPKGDLPYQSTTYEISGVQSHRLAKGDANDILFVVPQGNKPFPLTMKVTVKLYSYKKELASASSKPLPEEARAFLAASEGVNPKSPVLLKLVAALKGDDTVSTARNILSWMKKNIDYKLETRSLTDLDFKTVDEIVERGHAECRGYAILFTGLCRAAGIPARTVWGLQRVGAGQEASFGDIASHNWTEIYVSGCGWIPVDPQRPETLGCLPNNNIRIFMDTKKSKNSPEAMPMLNLVFMNGDKIKFDESR